LLVYVLLEVFETFQNNIHNSMYLRSNVVFYWSHYHTNLRSTQPK